MSVINAPIKRTGKIPWVVAMLAFIPAGLAFFLFCALPTFQTIILSFKKFSPRLGIGGSEFIGFENYKRLFGNSHFPDIYVNTIINSLLPIILGAIFVFGITLGISKLKNVQVKFLLLCVLIFPALMPMNVFVAFLLQFNGVLTNPSSFFIAPILNELLRIVPLFIVAGTFATMKKDGIKPSLFVTASYFAIRMLTFFTPDIGFFMAVQNPVTMQKSEVLSSYAYKLALTQNDVSGGAAVQVMSLISQIIPTAFAIFLLIFLPKMLFERRSQTFNYSNYSHEKRQTQLFSLKNILTWVITALLIAVMFFLVYGLFFAKNIPPLATSGALTTLLSIVIFAVLFLSLSVGIAQNNIVVLIVTPIFLVLSQNVVGQYMQMRNMYLINTTLGVSLTTALGYCAFFALLFYIATAYEEKKNTSSFFSGCGAQLIAFMGIALTKIFSETLYAKTYRSVAPQGVTIKDFVLLIVFYLIAIGMIKMFFLIKTKFFERGFSIK